jgi:predicted amidophosphoribosyltransferase
MTIELRGNWKKGFAYDVHTLDSVYIGVDNYGHRQWETTRSEMGELVYQLKYRSDISAVTKIADLLGKYKGLETMDAIIPVPSTNQHRVTQPTYAIAHELGKRTSVPVLTHVLKKRTGGPELKNTDNSEDRKSILRNQMILAAAHDLSGKNVLLLDDLYRSGATLFVATEILYEQARCHQVFVLTMTKTRNRS